MSGEKMTQFEYVLLAKKANASLSSSWPQIEDLPAEPQRKQRKKRKGPAKAKLQRRRLGVSQRARLHGWNRWKKPFLSHFSTMHQRVSEKAGMDYGVGVQGPFGKIVGNPSV